MRCPVCESELQQVPASDLVVDACVGGCGGIWFDQLELQKVDEAHEEAGQALLDVRRDPSISMDSSRRVNCPKCDVVMMRHFFSIKRNAEVDECPKCGGYWLDFGDLGEIRRSNKTEVEREAAAKEYFEEMFGADLAAMREESDEKLEKAKRIAHVFRFICPSNYIPGKQEWGAF